MSDNVQMYQGPILGRMSTSTRFRQIPPVQTCARQNTTLSFRQTSQINYNARPLTQRTPKNTNVPSPIDLSSVQSNTYSSTPLQNTPQLMHNSNTVSTTPPIERQQRWQYATVPWMTNGTGGKKRPNLEVEEIVVKIVYHKGIYDSRLRDTMKLMDVYEEMVTEFVQNLEVKLHIELAKALVYKTMLNR